MKKKNVSKVNRNWKENPPLKPSKPDPTAHKDPCPICESLGHCNHCNHSK